MAAQGKYTQIKGDNLKVQCFKRFVLLEIRKTRTTPFHARSVAMVERMNRTMQNTLSEYLKENQKDWDLYLDFIMMTYNTCEHENTGCSPGRILYGENIVLPIDSESHIAEEGTVES